MTENAAQRVKNLEEMIQVVLLAIPTEQSAYDFYMSASKKSTAESSRKLFESLAMQERGHEAELKRILSELKDELKELNKGA